ncbi:MAG: hypothetical protein KF847_21185, partial [Pirellulales bacterium]|nr:hypothetical protein [Pirellulales bacterium]
MPSRPLPLLSDLARSERQVYSQNGEDGVIRALLDAIGETNRFCVEFGVGDGTECCTRVLVEQGWSWLWLDGAAAGDDPRIHQAWVNAETIVPLFQMHKVP